jgi:hypothetical protein
MGRVSVGLRGGGGRCHGCQGGRRNRCSQRKRPPPLLHLSLNPPSLLLAFFLCAGESRQELVLVMLLGVVVGMRWEGVGRVENGRVRSWVIGGP